MRPMSPVSRRRLLLGGLSVAALVSCSPTPGPEDPADPNPPVPPTEARIEALERRYNVVVGLSAVDVPSGRWLAHRAKERFAMCSTFKAYAAAAVLQRAERGELALTDAVTIESADIISHSPVTETRVGATMTLAELCEAALQVSDNAAANLLLRVLGGPPAITEFARGIGDEESRLDRFIGSALEAAGARQLEEWMLATETSSMRAGLPAGWTSADKSGSGSYGTTNDVGIAYAPDGQRLLLSIMTKSAVEDSDAPNQRPLIGELAALAVADLYQSQ
jgi:beta-lactamase class A